jgi:hypothetical protein
MKFISIRVNPTWVHFNNQTSRTTGSVAQSTIPAMYGVRALRYGPGSGLIPFSGMWIGARSAHSLGDHRSRGARF